MKGILKANKNYLILFFILICLSFLFGCNGVTPIGYTITATTGTGGSISPSGELMVSEGSNQTFTITPNLGFEITDVLVDGISVGAVTSYTFQSIQQDHNIQGNFTGGIYNTDTGVYYSTIQEAIDAALGSDTIIVYPGTYDENIVFDNKNIILRSTDPQDPDIVAATIIDGGDNGSVVKFTGGDTSDLEGFTIQNGNTYYGGGIHLHNSTPTIKGNTIIGNKSQITGGGIAVYNSFSMISDNIITNNEAINGGGIYIYSGSPYIINNIIKNNQAGEKGGGIYVKSYDSILFPADLRPNGWGSTREDIPIGSPLIPDEGLEYSIAGNKFLSNLHGNPIDYTQGAHVYFEKYVSIL